MKSTNEEQARHWSATGADGWIELKAVIDQSLRPFTDLLVAESSTGSVSNVLDVGCGTGYTTLAASRRLGPEAQCVGIDLSERMIEMARSEAQREGARATFICGDAQTHPFARGIFDRVISRFGVMFFEDPVRAFANLRDASRIDAELRLVAWRNPAENPFMTTAERAAAPLLPALPARQPEAPGQFAWANRDHVFDILRRSGWVDIEICPIDVDCAFPDRELGHYFTKLGPLARLLPDIDAPRRKRVIETVRAAFTPYVHGTDVRFVAACWMICASASPPAHVRGADLRYPER